MGCSSSQPQAVGSEAAVRQRAQWRRGGSAPRVPRGAALGPHNPPTIPAAHPGDAGTPAGLPELHPRSFQPYGISPTEP